jgi:hypothetical protein
MIAVLVLKFSFFVEIKDTVQDQRVDTRDGIDWPVTGH